jgi:hypothetical protein
MKYRIEKYDHHATPFRLGFWWGRDLFRWMVKFDESCRYSIPGNDQLDINKLVGIGYFPGHHKNSIRFGWRYNATTDVIEIWAYAYKNRERIARYLTEVKFNNWAICSIEITPTSYRLTFEKETISIRHNHPRGLQYFLRPYFGGNRPAPHDMIIHVKSM